MDETINKAKLETDPDQPAKQLYRLPKLGKLAGVCAGLADYLNLDVTLIRIIFVVLTFASGGFGLILYIILALLMPVSNNSVIAQPSGDLGNNINALAAELKENKNILQLRNYIGLIIVLFGVWFLIMQFFPDLLRINWGVMWPILLIILGGLIIIRR